MLERDSALPQTDDNYDMLLTTASLFEGAFSIDWIIEVTQKKASAVLRAFEKAVREGVLKRDNIGYFIFADASKRRKWRRKLSPGETQTQHRLIADMLIAELPEDDAKALAVAPHLLNIVNDISGCKLLLAAARRYHEIFRTEIALQCTSKVLDDLSGTSDERSDALFCDAAHQYSKHATARHETRRVLSILEEAMMRAKNRGDYRYQSLLDMHFAKNKWLQSQYNSALKHFEQAWATAKDLADERLLRSTASFKTFFLFWQGRFQDAVDDYETSLPDVEKLPPGHFPLLATMTIGTCYGKIGQVTQGLGMIDAVRRQCLERGDIGLAAHSGICIGATMLDNGYVDEACRHLVESVKEIKKSHPDWTMIQGLLVLAYAYYRKEKYAECINYLTQYNEKSRQVQVSARTWPYLMDLCWAIEQGRLPAIPGISLQEEIQRMIMGRNIFLKGVAYRFQAQLKKKEAAPQETLIKQLKRSIRFLKISGHSIELAKSRLELARIYLLQRDRGLALETAEPAFKTLSTMNKNLIPADLKPLIQHTTPADTLFKEIIQFSTQLPAMKHDKDILQHIISAANRIVGAERGGIFLWEGAGHPLGFQLRASKNLTHEQIEHAGFSPSINMMTEVVTHGKGQVQSASGGNSDGLLHNERILSCICVPILSKQNMLGVLYHDNRLLSQAFDPSQLEILSFFSAQIALALESDTLRKENRVLTNRLRDMTAYYEQQYIQEHKPDVEEVIGGSPQIEKVLAQVVEVAQTNATVLILGETGVGKSMIAKLIRQNSNRKHKPFISLNCNALSETLIYSELFGHEKGAFTSADHQHIGRFEKANEGTLFLDEIGDLSPDVQVRLLRVLETKEFERVGGTTTLRSDFRLITATNSDLVRAMKEKRFREDLFYRINVFCITVPPLRERREDIALLIRHFIHMQAVETGKVYRPISDEEMRILTQYSWPGNVRELKNIVERYTIPGLSKTSIVDLLDDRNRAHVDARQAVTLRENERRHIRWALKETNGKIHGPGGAAELLDIHPNTLTFRMKKIGVERRKKRR